MANRRWQILRISHLPFAILVTALGQLRHVRREWSRSRVAVRPCLVPPLRLARVERWEELEEV